MNCEIKDFIGVFPNALDPRFCDSMIAFFNRMEEFRAITNRQKHDKALATDKEGDLLFTSHDHMPDVESYLLSKSLTDHFCQKSWECYAEYAAKYGVLNGLSSHSFYDDIKVQKTLPSQGYHIWHCETDNRRTGSRLLLVLAYLNDVEDGGETEFLYQSRRIPPKQGTILICPASFTHTHRGNPPLSGVKYVMNGWIEFTS